ncbi:MAG: hypothetical protein JNK74_06575 [Candidatus Hydrogenedentes bacterium]|nr:hypothetical protein [Candidatus Hydrogenedentota bacterium]
MAYKKIRRRATVRLESILRWAEKFPALRNGGAGPWRRRPLVGYSLADTPTAEELDAWLE